MAWWTIPGACVVLLRVLTLGDPAPADSVALTNDAAGVGPAAATDVPALVRVRDASTGMTGMLPLAAMAERALVVCLPKDLIGREIGLTAWRRNGDQRDELPAMAAHLRVRPDGTVPMLGLPAGRYDVEVVPVGGTALHAHDVPAPGRAIVAPAAPPR